ncbi:hypothetical protein PGT21_002451 [Puccinia graminis f. sp. tritici]|uniref:Uncharacterized protein n=1 Tax=Puccinia graminis f. sp. tritici TaxID=56615 RepID=A0A5B0LWG9_PUCGR|nr:hypothetical protein PGT21_002451 [Puccinia graminis f. sp. tritici]
MPGQLVNRKIGHQGLASGLSKSTGTPVPRSRANVFSEQGFGNQKRRRLGIAVGNARRASRRTGGSGTADAECRQGAIVFEFPPGSLAVSTDPKAFTHCSRCVSLSNVARPRSPSNRQHLGTG